MTPVRGPEAPGWDVGRDALFVGFGSSAPAYYRCVLPALQLGCDWVGVAGKPPKLHYLTGLVGKESKMPNMLEDYKVVVLQQQSDPEWLTVIEQMQARGVKVIFEIDDYIHGIQHMDDHDFKDHFGREHLWNTEQAMKRCDAVICSTDYIKGMYRHFNKNIHVCQNGIDLNRYKLTRPYRETVNIGWAGATGHTKAITPWLQQVAGIMRIRPQTTFVSIGQPFGAAFQQELGRERAVAVPFAAIEQYPAAMTMLDVGIAPSGRGAWWRGKSDLRWLEAGALGIPLVASPRLYPNIEDGVTGHHAKNAMEATEKIMRLVDDPDHRTAIGEAAREAVTETRSIKAVAPQWEDVFRHVLGDPSE